MPLLVENPRGGRRRMSTEDSTAERPTKRRATSSPEVDVKSQISTLETQITKSRRHLNNLTALLELARSREVQSETSNQAVIGLCRVFCRLMVQGSLTRSSKALEQEVIVFQWLQERYHEYVSLLIEHDLIDEDKSRTAVTLLMQLVKQEATYLDENQTWRTGTFFKIMQALMCTDSGAMARSELMSKFVKKYDDIRFYTFSALNDITKAKDSKLLLENVISFLAAIDDIPKSQQQVQNFFISTQSKQSHSSRALQSHKKKAQAAWLTVLRNDLNKAHRKMVLGLMSLRIVPWFLKPELLLDFLTDSFNAGGSTSLMALSGLFYLIREKNLDYPEFYQKLYSLLNQDALHSKHRTRFFRLFETFLASTHLPAALVASFVKRLSRLALYSPPAGIVFVVPWIYNLLKAHPTCTFMIHRRIPDQGEKTLKKDEGAKDPFCMEEPDPLQTDAIESSLWEIEMLQSHYHPNVATIARIISAQFTKEAYNLEDFLDHSYASMLDMELSKDMTKNPVIEYEIPKRIFTREGEGLLDERDNGIMATWRFYDLS